MRKKRVTTASAIDSKPTPTPMTSFRSARGAAQRVLEDARAYRDRVIADAEGEAARFEALLTEYQKAPR